MATQRGKLRPRSELRSRASANAPQRANKQSYRVYSTWQLRCRYSLLVSSRRKWRLRTRKVYLARGVLCSKQDKLSTRSRALCLQLQLRRWHEHSSRRRCMQHNGRIWNVIRDSGVLPFYAMCTPVRMAALLQHDSGRTTLVQSSRMLLRSKGAFNELSAQRHRDCVACCSSRALAGLRPVALCLGYVLLVVHVVRLQ